MISKSEAESFLHYDQESGIFTWSNPRSRNIPAGARAGCTHYSGYRKITLNHRTYMEHRLAWLFAFGEWPSGQIDHINGVRDDNRIRNLRVVSNKQNAMNQSTPKSNTSGVMGVHWHKTKKKWQATIAVGGKKIHLGRYDEFMEAVEARRHAERLHGFHENHGKPVNAGYKDW